MLGAQVLRRVFRRGSSNPRARRDAWVPAPPLGFRRPSPDLVRRLKDVSPRLDAVYLGKGLWSIVEFSQKGERIRHGREQLARLRARGATGNDTSLMLQCMAEGWSSLVLRACPEMDERDVRLAAARINPTTAAVEAGFRDADDEMTGHGVEIQAMRKSARHDSLDAYRDAHRFVRRRPHSV